VPLNDLDRGAEVSRVFDCRIRLSLRSGVWLGEMSLRPPPSAGQVFELRFARRLRRYVFR